MHFMCSKWCERRRWRKKARSLLERVYNLQGGFIQKHKVANMAAELQSLAQQLNVAGGDEEAWKQEYWDDRDRSQEGRI